MMQFISASLLTEHSWCTVLAHA